MSMRAALVMITVVGAASGAAAAGYNYLSGAGERAREQAEARRVMDIRIAMSRHLERTERPPLRSVVAGRETAPSEWAFRAVVVESDEKFSPAYGSAILRCEEDFERAACWTLAELTVDGRQRLKLTESEKDVARKLIAPTPEAVAPPPQPEAALDIDASSDAQIPPADRNEQAQPGTEAADEQGSVFDGAISLVSSAANSVRATLLGEKDARAEPESELEQAADDENANPSKEDALDAKADVTGAEDKASDKASDTVAKQDEEALDDTARGAASGSADEAAAAAAAQAQRADEPGKAVENATSAASDKTEEDTAAERSSKGQETLQTDIGTAARAGDDAGKAAAAQTDDAASAPQSEAENAEAAAPEAEDAQTAAQDAALSEGASAAASAADAQAEAQDETRIDAENAQKDAQKDEAASSNEAQASAAQNKPSVATHVVRVSEVNARRAPSMRGRVLAVVVAGQELRLIDKRGGWGRYQLIGGEFDGETAWIFGRLVTPAS